MLSIVSCSLGRAVSRCALTNAAASCRFAAATKLVRFQSNKSDLKYTEKHEWIRVNGSQGVVGITDYAQDKLGEVVYVELPTIGDKVEQSGQFATLESVKAVSECYSPVSGKIVAVNDAVKENPSAINKSPFDDGWLIKIEIANKSEIDKLLTEAQYNEFLKSEQH